MKPTQTEDTKFPISKTKIITGNRRLVREKVMQILVAHLASNPEINILFEHIFHRDFNIDDDDKKENNEIFADSVPLFTDEEIINMHADSTIN
jgi:hypothetical protein